MPVRADEGESYFLFMEIYMMKKKILKIIGVLLLSVFLVACSFGQPTETSENPVDEPASSASTVVDQADQSGEGQTTISFVVSSWEQPLYENKVEQFEAANPNINVEFVLLEDVLGGYEELYNDPDAAMLTLAQAADVIETDVISDNFSNLFIDLNPFLDEAATISRDDFYDGVLDLYAQDGGVHGIPSTLAHLMILYNKEMFDAAGVEYPQPGWTWDDFLATAQAVTEKSGAEVTQYGFSNEYNDPWTFISARAGQLVDTSGPAPVARLTDPAVIEGVQWYIDLATKYEVMPNPNDQESIAEGETFDYEPFKANGKDVAMVIDSIQALDWLAQEGLELGVVPFPVSAENQNTSPISPWQSKALAISQGSSKTDAAWKWVSFLLSQGSGTGEDDGFFSSGFPTSLPSRQSVAESTNYFDDLDPETAEAIKFAADHSFVVNRPKVGTDEIYNALYGGFNEGADVTQLLTEGQEKFDEAVSEQANEEPTPVPEISVAEPPSSQISEDAQVVNFTSAGGDPFAYRTLAKAFNEANPEYFVKIEEPNFTGDFSMDGMLGDADCFDWWSPITAQEELDRVLSLQPFFDADPDFSEGNLFKGALDQHRQNGQIMGVPSSVDLSLLSYSKKLHDEAGVPYPQPGWTLDDFLDNAVAIATDGPDDTRTYGYVPALWNTQELFTFLDIQGVDFIDDSVDPPQANFTSPEFAAAVRWYTDLVTQHNVSARFNVSNSGPIDFSVFDDRQDIIDSGRAGMWVDDGGGVIIMGDDGSDGAFDRDPDVDMVPYPAGPSGSSTLGNSGGYYISADTQSRQGCWEWIKYLSETEASVSFGIPANVNAVNSPEFAQKMGAENVEMIADTLQNSVSNSSGLGDSWIGGAFEFLDSALNQIYDDGLTVEEAMQGAQDKADVYRQCVIENDIADESDWGKFSDCLKEADPNYDPGF